MAGSRNSAVIKGDSKFGDPLHPVKHAAPQLLLRDTNGVEAVDRTRVCDHLIEYRFEILLCLGCWLQQERVHLRRIAAEQLLRLSDLVHKRKSACRMVI